MKHVHKFASAIVVSLIVLSASSSTHAASSDNGSNLESAFARYCLSEKHKCEDNIEASSDDVLEMMMGYCAREYDRCLLELQRR